MARRDQILHTGVLFKKGSGIDYPFGRKNWKPRYFVLTPSALKYYNYEGGSWKGEVDLGAKDKKSKELLTTLEVMPVDSKKTGKSASTIWRIAINSSDRRLLLSASSEMEMNVWVEKLTLALEISRGHFPFASKPRESQESQARPRTHRMSLPDNPMGTRTTAFIVDFPGVTISRRRASIGAVDEPASISISGGAVDSRQQQQQLWELPIMSSTGSLASPQAQPCGAFRESADFDGAVRKLVDEEFKSSGSGSSDDSTDDPSSPTVATPPRRQQYYSERMSLPSSFDSERLSSALPPKSIADFHNFSRSRRRMSMDSDTRLQRRLSMDVQQRVYAQSPLDGDDDEDDAFGAKHKEKTMTEDEDSVEETAKPLAKETQRRWRRFTRFREWLSRH